MIPVYFKTGDFVEPAPPLYYLVTAQGNFLVKKTSLFTSITEVTAIPGLLDQGESLSLRFPKVPREILEQMYGFFDAVYQKWEGEAIVFLYYSPGDGAFRLEAPPQTLFRHQSAYGFWRTEMKVEYGYWPRPPGFIKLGDAHSHADLPAFFSCTDDRDDQEDGLRITLGHLDRARPDVSVSFVASGARFALKAESVLEDFSAPLPPPPAWLERVTCREKVFGLKSSKASENGAEGRRSEKDGR
jgi:hypothetical protein